MEDILHVIARSSANRLEKLDSLGINIEAVYGTPFTDAGYVGAWVQEEFWKAAINTSLVCIFVVCTSLTIGTLGGYALSRTNYRYVFWLLIAALIFRAMPPITLVSGYLLPFFELNVWSANTPSKCRHVVATHPRLLAVWHVSQSLKS